MNNKANQLLCAHSAVVPFLFLGTFLFLPGWFPPPPPDMAPDLVKLHFDNHSVTIRLAMIITAFSGVFWWPFSAAIAGQMKRMEGGTDHVLARTQMAAGIVAGVERRVGRQASAAADRNLLDLSIGPERQPFPIRREHGLCGIGLAGAGERLAARVKADTGSYDLAEIAAPIAQQLRDELGEPTKLSVRDGDRAKVIVAVLGRHEYTPAPSIGTSYPLHAGAASKMIMAHMSPADLERHLSAPLIRYTPRTITDPEKLRADLAKARKQGFATDLGEHNLSVHAVAAPVLDPADPAPS